MTFLSREAFTKEFIILHAFSLVVDYLFLRKKHTYPCSTLTPLPSHEKKSI